MQVENVKKKIICGAKHQSDQAGKLCKQGFQWFYSYGTILKMIRSVMQNAKRTVNLLQQKNPHYLMRESETRKR